jgi:hypothetical protein
MRGFIWSLALALMVTGAATSARADVQFAIESTGEGLWDRALVATTEGRSYRIADPAWGELVLREVLETGEFDGDGLPDALIAMDTGGNCCPQDFAVVSYRGDGFFATLGPPESMGWGGLDVTKDDYGLLIRSHHTSSGMGNTENREWQIDY